jgi:hypothetical protein
MCPTATHPRGHGGPLYGCRGRPRILWLGPHSFGWPLAVIDSVFGDQP